MEHLILPPRRPQCEAQVKGFAGARYKKFPSQSAAAEWISDNGSPTKISPSKPTTLANVTSDSKGKKRNLLPDADENEYDVVYSDGACKGNGKASSVAGVGVWWGKDDPRNLAERCPGDQTNNRAELIAILRILETAPPSKRGLLIKSDSQYSIACFQDWLPNWVKNGWKNASNQPVKNAAIIKYLSAHLDARARRGQKVRLQYVKAHNGEEGNEGADAQANLGCYCEVEEEKDWGRLEADFRRKVEAELRASPEKPVPVPLEVEDQDDLALRAQEGPAKIRKLEAASATTGSTSNPTTQSAIPPIALNSEEPPTSIQLTDEDWEQYADGLLDDDDLLADMSD
ncbi:ribonuclease H-like domain-containing protein [Mycena crocata]|nr:ribonuclease H-like domain-containing protein [Mycena crocata]